MSVTQPARHLPDSGVVSGEYFGEFAQPDISATLPRLLRTPLGSLQVKIDSERRHYSVHNHKLKLISLNRKCDSYERVKCQKNAQNRTDCFTFFSVWPYPEDCGCDRKRSKAINHSPHSGFEILDREQFQRAAYKCDCSKSLQKEIYNKIPCEQFPH